MKRVRVVFITVVCFDQGLGLPLAFGGKPRWRLDRRDFIRFMGRGTAAGIAIQFLPAWADRARGGAGRSFRAISPSSDDALVLAEGLKADVLLRWGDALDHQGDLYFGYNCDYTAYFPLPSINEGLLWVNHEYTHPLFFSTSTVGGKSREQTELEMRNVGGSVVHIRRDHGLWQPVLGSPYNRRFDALTHIPFAWPEPIDGMASAVGTVQNCAGGVTPWNTVLSCEENYQSAFGDYAYDHGGGKRLVTDKAVDEWYLYFNHSPEHYGWVVEINPFTGTAKKLISLGRFCHEGATTVEAADGRCVVYMGDDAAGECIYKFISDRPGSLDSGELYVADTFNGRWLSLSFERNAKLQAHFKSQTDVLLRTREAARIAGGTPQDRPEDIKIDPLTGAVIVALTNNKANKNLFGSLLKIEEAGGDPLAMDFSSSVFLMGGEASGFACPDNLAFDRHGHLWMTSDISSSAVGKKEYAPFKNNGLFVIPMRGANAGRVLQVASAPVDAELTGPFFSPDGNTLFLSIQHPGEESTDLNRLTSHWPDGGTSIPKPSVVAISGPLLRHPERIIF